MAGRRKPEQVAPSAALVASAVTYSGLGKVENVYRPMESWQQEAWSFYDSTPELRFAATWLANAASRCILRPAKLGPDNELQASDSPATREALRQLFGNSDGQSQMMYQFALHVAVAGECYLVGRKMPANIKVPDGKMWEVVGVREIHQHGSGWTIDSGIDGRQITLAEGDTVLRIWRPHPAYRHQADSPVRALLPVLSEIRFLTLHIYAQTISRLSGAGMMILPKSLEFPGSEGLPDGEKAQKAMELLGGVMAKAIENPADPSALIPILMMVADELVGKVQEPLHFWSPFDEKAVVSRQAALSRFYTGFDLPPEVISGMSANMSTEGGRGTGLSHWGQWQIEESAIKMHIEPLIEVIVNGLVLQYIRPITDDGSAALLIDTTALKLQPDRSKEAAEAHAAGALNDDGLRHYTGLSADYAPQDEDIKRRILWKMATGSAAPEMVLKAAEAFGVELGLTAADVAGQQPANEARPDPTTRRFPDRGMPDRNTALLPACEMVVMRALERAGGRLRNMGVKPEGVPQEDVYQFASVNGNAARFLEGAWCHVPKLAEQFGCDPASLTSALNAYAESLLIQKAPHSRESLAKYLKLVK